MVSVADNWDHNEHTLSGKQTTHAMTSILDKTIFCLFCHLDVPAKQGGKGAPERCFAIFNFRLFVCFPGQHTLSQMGSTL